MKTPTTLYALAMQQCQEWYGPDLMQKGACLYLSQCTMRVLLEDGRRPVLQAGTMYWPVKPDDGHSPTHWGYEWSPEEQFSKQALAQGLFPECHVWCALPEEGMLVDFSTGFLKELAVNHHKVDWTLPAPPPFVWGAPPEGAVYRPSLDAIRFTWAFILEKFISKSPDVAATLSRVMVARLIPHSYSA